jgi:hypothetical protein
MIRKQTGIVNIRPSLGKVISGKQIIYRFNGDPKYDERVSDGAGNLPFLNVGKRVTRNGKQWQVAVVRDELNMASSRGSIPIHRVFLTDKF